GMEEAFLFLRIRVGPSLYSKIKLETDSKLLRGKDVAIAAMLGAEEFGFATAPLISMGCVMMRVCNLDTCPVGIATQNPELRKRFRGKPEYVINFMRFVAQDLREYMAKLGIRTVDELVGRTDLLKVNENVELSKHGKILLDDILNNPYISDEKRHFDKDDVYDFKLGSTKDETVLFAQLKDAIDNKQSKTISVKVDNVDRAFGTILGSKITKKYGENTLEDDTFKIRCQGAGGQSFGAFIPKGLTLELEGDSNDYIGKGLSGGKIIVYPPKGVSFKADENIIIGNVAFYGATSGKAYINGVAGERFCVRNSGARVVVEGVGDHGLEYMTGGKVVILGKTGNNLAAGMSGGVAFVLDEENTVYSKLNRELVSLEQVRRSDDVRELKSMIEEHVAATGSQKGRMILESFEEYLPKFKKIMPHDYKKMLDLINEYNSKGLSYDQAEIVAFYNIKGDGSNGKDHRLLRV
ncbi:MAG: glutamate synthase-related protein, partial [Acutalibacteraceae bacterium]